MQKLKIVLLVMGCLLLTACGCSKKEYTVTFDSNGGSKIASVKVTENETVSKPKDPSYERYTFVAWYLNDKEYNFSDKVTKNITLVAKWKKKAAEPAQDDNKKDENKENNKKVYYTVTFDTNGGTEVKSIKVLKNSKIEAPTTTKEHYKFVAWQLNDKDFDFNTKITSKIKLVAKWEYVPTISYLQEDIEASVVGQTILYVTKDGEKVDGYLDITTTSGKTITKEISKDGYMTNKNIISKIENAKIK